MREGAAGGGSCPRTRAGSPISVRSSIKGCQGRSARPVINVTLRWMLDGLAGEGQNARSIVTRARFLIAFSASYPSSRRSGLLALDVPPVFTWSSPCPLGRLHRSAGAHQTCPASVRRTSGEPFLPAGQVRPKRPKPADVRPPEKMASRSFFRRSIIS